MADKLQNLNDSNGLLPPGTTTYNNYDRGVQVGHADTFLRFSGNPTAAIEQKY